MKVELTDEGRVQVFASYVEKDAVKAIPGSRWTDGAWTVPGTWAACLALRGTFGQRLEVGPRLAAWSVEEFERRVGPASALRTATATDKVFDPRLKDFQQAGVEWLLTSRDGALLGDDVGAGKTVQLCVALREAGVRRGIVVAPKSMLFSWRDHLEEWAGLRAVVVAGTAAKRRTAIATVEAGLADVVVCSWDTIRGHSRLAAYGGVALTAKDREPGELNRLDHEFVIADEVQRCKDPKSKSSRALWSLGDAPTVTVRYGATATPVGNALDDLWSIMRFVSPAEWPAKSKFVDRYCDMTWNQWGGLVVGGARPDTSAELFGFLDPRYRAMSKAVVLKDLPPTSGGMVEPMLRYAEMSTKQAKAYNQMLEESVADLDGGRLLGIGAMQRAGRLLSLASAYGTVESWNEAYVDPDDGLGKTRLRQKLTLSEPSCKLDVLEDLLTGELSSEESVVVFTVSRQLAQLAAARATKVTGRESRLLVGGQSAYERDEAIRDFQAGKAGTIVATVAAGGAGVTLTKSRVEVILQRDFSYINNVQMEGRVHRIGSEVHERVLYYDVVTPGTPDLRVLEVLQQKGEISEQVTRWKSQEALARWLLTGEGAPE